MAFRASTVLVTCCLALVVMEMPTVCVGLLANFDSTDGGSGSGCIWDICSMVIVSQMIDDSGAPKRSLMMHRCDPSTRYPEKCLVSEVVADSDGVSNVTMRRAELASVDVRGFCLFERLSGLDLSENRIAEFRYPTNMSSRCLSRLRWFSLRGNRLRSVDIAQFTRFPELEKIDLSENGQLETLYISELTFGTRLSAIIAQKCRIKQVDISLVRLPSLQDVDLNYNQLSELTNRLEWRWTVAEVRLIEEERNRRKTRDPYYYARLSVQMVQNQFTSSAFSRRRLWGLPVPDLQHVASSTSPDDAVVNELKRYRDAFQSFLYLDHVGSTIACDCHLFHAWNYLRRAYADPREFSKRNALSIADWVALPCESAGGGFGSGHHASARNIVTLSAEDLACSHSVNCPEKCNCTERVSPSILTVDCRGRQLRQMPDRLPDSVHPVRYALQLAGNQISELRALPTSQAVLVQQLDLSDNMLSDMTDFTPLEAYRHAHSVNLSGNWLLTDLPDSLLTNATSRLPGAVIHLSVGQLVCHWGLLKPDYARQMGWLLAEYRQLRCRLAPTAEDADYSTGWRRRRDRLAFGGGVTSEAPLLLSEFHHRFCLTAPPQPTDGDKDNSKGSSDNSSPQPTMTSSSAGSNILLYVIVCLVAAVLIVLIAALVCIFACQRSHHQVNQRRQHRLQLQSNLPVMSTYDVANPSIRYVSCSESQQKLYESSVKTLALGGASPIRAPVSTKPLLASSRASVQQQLREQQTVVGCPISSQHSHDDGDVDSSDFSSGDLSDTESAAAAPPSSSVAGSPYQTVLTAAARSGRHQPICTVDLPPPLPPRPTAVSNHPAGRLANVTVFSVDSSKDSGTNL